MGQNDVVHLYLLSTVSLFIIPSPHPFNTLRRLNSILVITARMHALGNPSMRYETCLYERSEAIEGEDERD